MTEILDGKELSAGIRAQVKDEIDALPEGSIKPTLAIVLATSDESATTYVRIIEKAAEKVGIRTNIIDLGDQASHDRLTETIRNLADDQSVHGIIIQTPVPTGIDIDEARSLIPLEKDIDGANPLSAGRLFSGLKSFAPATAKAVIQILQEYKVEAKGKHAVVIGRSRIVGKPVAHMLLDLDATVTICHSATKDLAHITKQADILVVAAGKINLVSKEHIDPDKNTIVVDVGTNFDEQGKLVGDADFNAIQSQVGAITPVPGGVGPVTTAILLQNTLDAYVALSQKTP